MLARIQREERELKSREEKTTDGGATALDVIVRVLRGRLAFGVAVALIAALLVIPTMIHRQVELAMFLPTLKGGPPPDSGKLVDASVVVSVNWNRHTIRIPLKAGGDLTGQFNPARQPAGNVPALPLVFDVSVDGSAAGQPVIGTGQFIIMPGGIDGTIKQFSTNAILWARLDLRLRSGGQQEPLYRVFGTP